MDPHSRAAKKNTSHGNQVLPQDTTHLIQRPCYQQGSPCQDPAGNWTTWRSPDDRKKTQTAVVWSCFPFIRSVQNHLARHSERGKKTRRTKEEVGRQHQGMDRPGVRQVPEGSGEQGKIEKTGCKIICGAPTTLAVKGLMMMMMGEGRRRRGTIQQRSFFQTVLFSVGGGGETSWAVRRNTRAVAQWFSGSRRWPSDMSSSVSCNLWHVLLGFMSSERVLNH